ncbi:MAG: chorismate-binding protein [Phycisphaerales bacterium]
MQLARAILFSLDEQRNVTTRPIKGTRPASADPRELLNSAKDHAELTMIVDLLRNDLGRVSKGMAACGSLSRASSRATPPSTTPPPPSPASCTPAKHSSTCSALSCPAVRSPGAPKVRAMQIIDELEPVRRGPYTGAIGYIHGESACFNIAIRTLLIEAGQNGQGRVDYSRGGIVADSHPPASTGITR